MTKNEYLKLVDEASKKKLQITKQMEKDIREVYRNVAKDLEKQILKANPNTITEKWLHDYRKELNREIDNITKNLYKSNKDKMKEMIEASNSPQLSLFQSINSKYDLGLETTFNSMFSRVNSDALNEILRGNIYRDGKGLNDRLWIDAKYMKKDIQIVILEGIASKKSAYDLAKDLEKYVNPDMKKDFEWSKAYPGTRKKIDYNAQRLARTSIQHAYQTSQKRSCERNPFIDGLEWNSVFSHGRTCEICMERHGEIFKVEDTPLDHPNGLCFTTPVITMSFEEIGETLGEWVNYIPNNYTKGIDRWMEGEL